ncbi:DUF3450 family protein [Rubritalea marina]|uniref:DUF3450 family protein n=1 Tax=Rubritalea marina TaxID=361055 RepID=UPI0003827F2D|nr:DUF3450 family protein [Rubritalea marina]
MMMVLKGLRIAALVPMVAVMAADGAGSEALGETLEQPLLALKLVEERVANERQLSEEMLELQARRVEEERLKALYRVELDAIRKQVEAAGSAHTQDMESLRRDQEFVRQAKSKRQDMQDALVQQIQRIEAMQPLLPELLKQQLETEYARLGDADAALKDKIVACSTYLQKLAKFDQSISYAEEFHEIKGQEKQLEILYLGFGGAYFVSGGLAGRGTVSAAGWQWQVDEGLASEAKRAMAIFKKNARPDLVKLPVQITK